VTACYCVYCSDVELCKYTALYIHVFCCHCIIVYFNAVRSFDRKSEINHQFSSVQLDVSANSWLCVFGGRGLCVFGGLCVDMWRLVHQRSFFAVTVLDCFWRLVHCCYTVGTVLLDLWRSVHQWSFLTVFDDCTLLIHCWYSLGRPVTIGTPTVIFAVLTVFLLFWYTVGTLLVQFW